MKITIIFLFILYPIFCYSQNEIEKNIELSSQINTDDSIMFHLNFYKQLDLKIVIKDINIVEYQLVNNDKTLNIQSKYSLYSTQNDNILKPRCVTSNYLDHRDSIIYSKYFCNELVVVYDFNYEINLPSTFYILELNYSNENSNTIDIKIYNKDNLARFGYNINLNEKTYEYGEFKSIKRINDEYEKLDEPGIILTEIIEINQDKFGIWTTKNFQNEIIKRELISYENIIEVK